MPRYKQAKADGWIIEQLADGPVPVRDLIPAARAAGIPATCLMNGFDRLYGKKYASAVEGNGTTCWVLHTPRMAEDIRSIWFGSIANRIAIGTESRLDRLSREKYADYLAKQKRAKDLQDAVESTYPSSKGMSNAKEIATHIRFAHSSRNPDKVYA